MKISISDYLSADKSLGLLLSIFLTFALLLIIFDNIIANAKDLNA